MADERDGGIEPVSFVGYVGLLWGVLRLTARQHGFAHNSLPSFLVIMAPSGTRRLNSHICRLSIRHCTGLADTHA